LQSLINQYSELVLIPVVGRRIEDLDNLKSLFKQAPNHEIGLLDTKIEAKDLILKPVGNSLKYEEDAVTAILELTSGHAYLTQAVCYSLFLQAEEEEKSVITAADVKSIKDDAIELAQGGLAWFRDGLPISERVVFSAVAQAEKVADKGLDKAIEEPLKLLREYGVITTTALSKAPENLVQWGFLERVEDSDSEFRYRIKVKLVRYWLTKFYPLRQAIWELKDADLESQKLFDLATEVSEDRNLPLSNLYETILELNPNHFPALFKLAEVYLDIKDFEKSRDNYKRAYEVDPTRADEGYKLAKRKFIPIRWKIILDYMIASSTVFMMILIILCFFLFWNLQKIRNRIEILETLKGNCLEYKPNITGKKNNQTNAIIIGSQSPKNVRSGFGTVCPVIETINTGTRIRVIAFASDNDGYKWYSIYNPKTHIAGWIAGQLIQIDKGITPVPLSSPQPTTKPSPSK
jgi:tetratricopeptide (TPR) repeat protein